MSQIIAFIGGGNMASAIFGGLIAAGRSPSDLIVVEPDALQRARLLNEHGLQALEAAGPSLARADVVVWAVKPQLFKKAAAPCAAHVGTALQLSVMAGIRTDAVVAATGSERVVRAMPNTPALIGRGIAGLYARDGVTVGEKEAVEGLLEPTGTVMWVERESDLDAVTALSGSGPAYVFYMVEAMVEAAKQMGLSPEQGKQLALATFAGSTELAMRSSETPETLRDRVTSKGGTTYAALASLESDGVKAAFVRALRAAQQRAKELGDEFGT
jgi:pyrroline-5-carboxylate reductase